MNKQSKQWNLCDGGHAWGRESARWAAFSLGKRIRVWGCVGFSLVEVTLALGMVSFAVIAVLGLIPTGLTTLRQAMNQTVEAQIVKSIGAQSVMSNFTNLATNTIYFDDEGLPTDDAAEAFYTVDVTTNPPIFPGSANAINYADSLTTLRIQIIARPNPAAVGKTNFYTLKVANSGK